MLELIGSLVGGLGKAKQYSALGRQASQQAALTRLRGESARNDAQREADDIEEADRANRYLRGMQQRQARGAQRQAVSAARNAHSGNNTTVEAGAQMEDRVREAWDAQIENMATSSSVTTANAMQRAIDTRYKGVLEQKWAEVEALGYDAQAKQYSALAKATRKSAQFGFIGGLIGGVAGGVSGYMSGKENLASVMKGIEAGDYGKLNDAQREALINKAEDNVVLSTLSGAGDYGSMTWDLYASTNPFLAGMQIDTKRSSGTLYGLLARGLRGANRSGSRSGNSGKSKNTLSDYEAAAPVASAGFSLPGNGAAYDWNDPGLFPPNDY